MDHINWTTQAGQWVEQLVIPYDYLPAPESTFSTAFMAVATWRVPTCLRYMNPQMLKDGRVIAGVVEEEGTPGEPGWVWRFYITEKIVGPVEWRVETRDCKVASLSDGER